MENASKALLIAGAILIVILLIGVGMMIFNSSQGIMQSATSTMSTKEKDIFNQQFTMYAGKINGSSLKGFLSAVVSNNANPDTLNILINDKEPGTDTSTLELSGGTKHTIINAKMYEVEIADWEDGLVKKFTITVINDSPST